MKNKLCLLLVLLLLSITPMSVFAANDNDKISDLTLPQTMSLSETNLTIVKKAPKYQLVAEIFPETAKQEVEWKSSDTKVCTVDNNGKITAKKVGSCTITATSKYNASVYKSCYVQVVEPTTPIEEFESEKEEYNVVVGKRVKLQYTIKPSNASNKYIKFTVEDKDVCTVDSSGYVYGNEEGDTTVKAVTDDGGFELEFYISVSEANTGTYDKFEDDYPNLRALSTKNVDEGIWMDVENIGMLFYDNYNGEFKKGWVVIEGEQYFFKDTQIKVWEDNEDSSPDADDQIEVTYTFPIMQTGWYQSLNSWCYLKSDGKLANNEWVRDNNKWYLIDKDGNMVTSGEKWIGNDRYVFADSGEAIVGFRVVDGSLKHYNQENCAMDINEWFKEPDGRWYYADENGNIVKSRYIRAADNTCDYYVDENGVMLFNQNVPDGRWADELGRIGYQEKVPDTSSKAKEETKEVGPGVTTSNNTPTY